MKSKIKVAYLIDTIYLCTAGTEKQLTETGYLGIMACGLPVIATAVGGNPELIDDTNGFCVPPDDPQALGEALARLSVSPELRKKIGDRSLEKVRSGFSWDITIYEWETFYKSLRRRN